MSQKINFACLHRREMLSPKMEQPVDVTAETEIARAVSVKLEVKLEVKREKEAKDTVDVSGPTKWERLVEVKQEVAAQPQQAARSAKKRKREAEGQSPQLTKPRPKSGFYGVSTNKSKWQAKIHYGGKTHSLGRYHTKEEAAVVYDAAAREHKGSEAECNFESAEAGAAAVALAVSEWEQQQQPPQPKPRPKSGFCGVSASGSKWHAQIRYGGKTHNLGSYSTKEEAAAVYDAAAREHKGSEAECNFAVCS